jgi:hypothetical protein
MIQYFRNGYKNKIKRKENDIKYQLVNQKQWILPKNLSLIQTLSYFWFFMLFDKNHRSDMRWRNSLNTYNFKTMNKSDGICKLNQNYYCTIVDSIKLNCNDFENQQCRPDEVN